MNIGVDHPSAAVVAIDCHRGHLDPAVATMPASPETAARLTAANKAFFDKARSRGVPVYHIVTTYRDVAEIRANPFWRTRAEDPKATRKNVLRHNLAGSPGCVIVPELHDEALDWVVDTKKRYDCFVGTDLEFLLRAHGINTLFVTGVNTNSCVLSTVAAACSKDFSVLVVEDCVDSMDGPALHEAALACIRTAFGFVLDTNAVMRIEALTAKPLIA